MDNHQPSDVPDGRGGFLLRDDGRRPNLDSSLASDPVSPTESLPQTRLDETKPPDDATWLAASAPDQSETTDQAPDVMDAPDGFDAPEAADEGGNGEYLDDAAVGSAQATDFPPPSRDKDLSLSHDSEPDAASDTHPEFSADAGEAVPPPQVTAQEIPQESPQEIHQETLQESPQAMAQTGADQPTTHALLGKISEMLGSLPKIDDQPPTQHPDNTAKHALATARILFSPQAAVVETAPVLSTTQRRGLQRLAHEEGLRQENIERIIAGSLGFLMPQATPDTIDKDWLSHFFDRARLAGDAETQMIWSRVLAAKANNPNGQSRKTIAILGEMDRGAQNAFQKLCGYAWRLGYPTLMIYAIDENFFRLSGLSFAEMTDLVAHGLLTIERTAHYVRRKLPRNILVYYGSEPWKLTLPKDQDNVMSLGVASFTRAGIELFHCINAREQAPIRDVIAEHWRGLGFSLVPLAGVRPPPGK